MTSALERGKKRAEEIELVCVNCSGTYARYKDEPMFYPADDIHRLLGEGTETFSMSEDMGVSSEWAFVERLSDNAKLQVKKKALLIGIRPLVIESPERQLLKDIYDTVFNGTNKNASLQLRIEQLLESGK